MEQNQQVEQFNKVLELVNFLKEGLCGVEKPVTHKGERMVHGSLSRNIGKLQMDGYVTFTGSPEKYSKSAVMHLSRIGYQREDVELAEIRSEITRKLGYCMVEGLQPVPDYTTEDLSIEIETAEAQNLIWTPEPHDDIRKTRYQGAEGSLVVTHSAKEDANVFIDNLYQSVKRATEAQEQREENVRLRKLGKLNIQAKAADLLHQDNTQDNGRTME